VIHSFIYKFFQGAFNFTIRDARTDSVLLQGEIDFRQAANISGLEGNPLFHIISLDNVNSVLDERLKGKYNLIIKIQSLNNIIGPQIRD